MFNAKLKITSVFCPSNLLIDQSTDNLVKIIQFSSNLYGRACLNMLGERWKS